jgi:DNA polymerase-3 subunit epsilon
LVRKVSFLDLETTGRFTPDHRIIEASFRICDLDTAEELEEHLFRINPERNIDAKARAVHGIELEDLKDEPTFEVVAPKIVSILEDCFLNVAHNGFGFDFPFLAQEIERVGLKVPDFQCFDTMVEGNFATDLGKSPTLSELCWALDIDADAKLQHRGDYDTLILKQAFFRGLELKWYKIDEKL